MAHTLYVIGTLVKKKKKDYINCCFYHRQASWNALFYNTIPSVNSECQHPRPKWVVQACGMNSTELCFLKINRHGFYYLLFTTY